MKGEKKKEKNEIYVNKKKEKRKGNKGKKGWIMIGCMGEHKKNCRKIMYDNIFTLISSPFKTFSESCCRNPTVV